MQPRPVQNPHPPLLVGGNSRRAIRRAVELGDGWNPFFTGGVSATARTKEMASEMDLAEGIDYMRRHCEKVGREQMPSVFLASITKPGEEWNPGAIIDRIGQFREMGVVGAAVHVGGRSRAEYCDNAERIGSEVLAKLD